MSPFVRLVYVPSADLPLARFCALGTADLFSGFPLGLHSPRVFLRQQLSSIPVLASSLPVSSLEATPPPTTPSTPMITFDTIEGYDCAALRR